MKLSTVHSERLEKVTIEFRQRFGRSPEIIARAPGRVDLIGSHTDYNQGYVLTQAIGRDTWIAARPRPDRRVRISSLNVDGQTNFPLHKIEFDHKDKWTNYVRGVADVLQSEGYALSGFDGLIDSTIPFGSGLSSSAALEVATALVFQELADWRIDPVHMARLCQRAENEFVGVNTGILDQYSSLLGQENTMLLLDTRSLESELIPVVGDVAVMICDTKSERKLSDSEYDQRRLQCERAVAVLQQSDPQIKALRDVTLAQLEEHRKDLSKKAYQRALFIIEENKRVLAVAQAVADRSFKQAGRLMNESFEGASELYEIVSPAMNAMHAAILAAPGSYGARGAGAGFGGVLVALVDLGFVDEFAGSVRQGYRVRTGTDTEVFPVRAAAGAGLLTRNDDG